MYVWQRYHLAQQSCRTPYHIWLFKRQPQMFYYRFCFIKRAHCRTLLKGLLTIKTLFPGAIFAPFVFLYVLILLKGKRMSEVADKTQEKKLKPTHNRSWKKSVLNSMKSHFISIKPSRISIFNWVKVRNFLWDHRD